MIHTILYIFLGILFLYTSFSVFYLFFFSSWGRLFYRNSFNSPGAAPTNRIAILVPAYREDGIILSTASGLLKLDYPRELYDIYIIADSFQPSTLAELGKLDVNVLEVSFDKSTKTKSLNEAFRRISKTYDIALICDADNILALNFLRKINTAFVNGAKAVQGRRVAKNLDTSFAILDACSEGINNNIFRKGANGLGLSSAVIGSGMAFSYVQIKEILNSFHAVGGFDKVLQLKLVEQGSKIIYMEDALIFDEKVDSSHAFKQQRKRWVSSQFIYLRQFFSPALKMLFKGNLSYFNLAVANNLILPRAFMFVLLPFLVLASIFVGTGWLVAAIGLCVFYFLSLVIAIPTELVNKDLGKAVLRLPKAVLVMMGTILHIKQSNKTFIHTVHTKTEINNPLFHEHVK